MSCCALLYQDEFPVDGDVPTLKLNLSLHAFDESDSPRSTPVHQLGGDVSGLDEEAGADDNGSDTDSSIKAWQAGQVLTCEHNSRNFRFR